jgi:4-hydroxy-3-polyprenylbenzoate decarboxylase
MKQNKQATVALAITGASGIQYALRLLQCLIEHGSHVYLMFSKPGQIVTAMDTDLKLPGRPVEMQAFLSELYGAAPGQLQVFGEQQWTAPVASGSGVPDALVVCPCTTGTLAAIATGQCKSLIERSVDVVLKERKKLIVMPREMPFSEIHLENMLRLARMGAVIMPPNPGFYFHPKSVDDLIDFVVARVLDHLDIEHQLMPRWGIDPLEE